MMFHQYSAIAVQRLRVCQGMDEITAVLSSSAKAVLDADGSCVVLRDGALCHYIDEDAIAPLWKGRRFPMEACISGWCMSERRSVAISDIYSDHRIPHDAYRSTFVKSLAMVPIGIVTPVGALGVYWSGKHTASREEIEVLETLAQIAGPLLARLETSQASHVHTARSMDHRPSLRRPPAQ